MHTVRSRIVEVRLARLHDWFSVLAAAVLASGVGISFYTRRTYLTVYLLYRIYIECWSIMHSSWIFSIDNEWILVVLMKPGPDFGKRILMSFSPDDR